MPSLGHPLPPRYYRGQESSSPGNYSFFVLCSFTLYLDSISSDLQVPLLDFMCMYVHMYGWALVYIYRDLGINHQALSLPAPNPCPFLETGSLTDQTVSKQDKQTQTSLPASAFPALRPQCLIRHLDILCGFRTLIWVLVVIWQMLYHLSCLLSHAYQLQQPARSCNHIYTDLIGVSPLWILNGDRDRFDHHRTSST